MLRNNFNVIAPINWAKQENLKPRLSAQECMQYPLFVKKFKIATLPDPLKKPNKKRKKTRTAVTSAPESDSDSDEDARQLHIVEDEPTTRKPPTKRQRLFKQATAESEDDAMLGASQPPK